MRAAPLGLRDGDRERLTVWTRSSTVQAGLAQRARIVLLAADGVSHTGIAERLDVSRQTVITPPKRLGVTHWSSRLLAAKLKIDHATVARAWKDYGVQPWRSHHQSATNREAADGKDHRDRAHDARRRGRGQWWRRGL
jgi:hypothetical protein